MGGGAGTGPEGFAEFVGARYAALVRHGTLLTGDRGHGEDLAQEALVKRDAADPYGPRDTARLVLDALRGLPAQQRVVLVLRYWAGLSEQEIAAMLSCSAGTVKSRASRAISALRRVDGPLAEAFERTPAGG